MWRKCDLHIHTTPNEQAAEQTLDAVDLVRRCLDRGLSVVAITDHDHARNVEAVIAAAGEELVVVAGVEVTTDHGHLLAVAPAANGPTVIQELISRAGIGQGSQRNFNEILQIVGQETGPTTGLFRESVVLIGAHVDSPGSLLGPQPLAATGQLELAEKLHALEVVSEERVTEWNRSGVKQSGKRMPLVRGSDAHTASIEDRFVHPAGAADEDRTKTTTEAVAISWRHHHPPARATAGLVSTEAVAISWRHRHPPTRATVILVEANSGVARRAYSNIGLRVVTSSSA